jgi:hypothetical protein
MKTCKLVNGDRLRGPPSLLSNWYRGLFAPKGYSGKGGKLTTHLQLMPRTSKVELYLYIDYRRGFGLVNGFIDYLYTRLGTTSNYSATANLHNSQITRAPVRPFPAWSVFTSLSVATASNSGDSSASCTQVLSLQPPMPNSALNSQLKYSSTAELNWLSTNWVAPNLFLVTTLHGPSRKHRFQQLLYCCARICCSGNVFTDPLPRNGLHNTVVYSPVA